MLKPSDVLLFVRNELEDFFRERRRLWPGRQSGLFYIIAPKASDTDVTLYLQRHHKRYIEDAVNSEQSREPLRKFLGFSAHDCPDFNEVRRRAGRPLATNVLPPREARAGDPDIELSPEERWVEAQLLTKILDSAAPVIYDFSPYERGLVTILPALMRDQRFANTYERIVFCHPHDSGDMFRRDLDTIVRSLGIEPAAANIGKIVEALSKARVLIVLCGTHVLGDEPWQRGNPLLARLLDHVSTHEFVRQQARAPLILLLGPSTSLEKRLQETNKDILPDKLSGRLAIVDLSTFMERQWLRFCRLRDVDPYAEVGSRMKRLRWHYEIARGDTPYAANVRLRAFFASNFANQAFFDPTGGFAVLAGMKDDALPIDVFLYKKLLELIVLNTSADKPVQRLARLISTSKHWLTEGALRQVWDSLPTSLRIEQVINKEERSERNARLPEWIKLERPQRRYIIGLGLRAVIQDAWTVADPAERACAHHAVARRLWDNQDKKKFLSEEFPYQPHWGRNRIHLLAETARHLVRAMALRIDDADGTNIDAGPEAKFPKLQNGAPGCHPRAVINFCYAVIINRELNGNHGNVKALALTRRHGAYSLAKELLQLISDPMLGFGHPHPALDRHWRYDFIRDCSLSALSVGELDLAKVCFARLRAEAEQTLALSDAPHGETDAQRKSRFDAAAAESEYRSRRVEAALDLALAHTTAGEFRAAEALLAEAQAMAQERIIERHQKRLLRRIDTRRAQLLAAERAIPPTELRDLFTALDENPKDEQKEDQRKAQKIEEAELLRAYVLVLHDAPGASDDSSPRAHDALARCLKGVFAKSADGHQHDAMGLKITLARLFLERGEAGIAEMVLDEVYRDITRFGCAERTFLRFLTEAGRVLTRRDSYRAYCVYLRRCVKRSLARGFALEARDAAALAITALDAVWEQLRDLDAAGLEALVAAQGEKDRSYNSMNEPRNAREYDPLYGFAMSEEYGAERWIRTHADYDREKQAILAALADAHRRLGGT